MCAPRGALGTPRFVCVCVLQTRPLHVGPNRRARALSLRKKEAVAMCGSCKWQRTYHECLVPSTLRPAPTINSESKNHPGSRPNRGMPWRANENAHDARIVGKESRTEICCCEKRECGVPLHRTWRARLPSTRLSCATATLRAIAESRCRGRQASSADRTRRPTRSPWALGSARPHPPSESSR